MEYISIKELITQTVRKTPEGASLRETDRNFKGEIIYIFTEDDPKTREAYFDCLMKTVLNELSTEMLSKLKIAYLRPEENEQHIKEALDPDNLRLLIKYGVKGIIIFLDNQFKDPSSGRRQENLGVEIASKIKKYRDEDFKKPGPILVIGASLDEFPPSIVDFDPTKFDLLNFFKDSLPKITKSFFDK